MSRKEDRSIVAVALTDMQAQERQAYQERRFSEITHTLLDKANYGIESLWDGDKYKGKARLNVRDICFLAQTARNMAPKNGDVTANLSKQSGEDLSRAVEAMARSNAVLSAAIAHAYMERHHPQDVVDGTIVEGEEKEGPLDSQ